MKIESPHQGAKSWFIYFHRVQLSNSFACVRALVPTQFYWCKDNVPQLLRDLSKMDLMGFILSRHTSSGMPKNTGRESIYVTRAAPGTTLDCTWRFWLCSFIYVWNAGCPGLMQDKLFYCCAVILKLNKSVTSDENISCFNNKDTGTFYVNHQYCT